MTDLIDKTKIRYIQNGEPHDQEVYNRLVRDAVREIEEALRMATQKDLIVQGTGGATDVAMSQDSSTKELNKKADKTVQIIAGNGLSGGGTISSNVGLTVKYGTTQGTAVEGHDARVVNAVSKTRKIISGTGLSGGGDLSADRTLSVKYGTTAGTALEGDAIVQGLGQSTTKVMSQKAVTDAIGSGNSGSSDTASKLTTPRQLRASLDHGGAQTFDGSANATNIGVTGKLPISKGGTDGTTIDTARDNLELGRTQVVDFGYIRTGSDNPKAEEQLGRRFESHLNYQGLSVVHREYFGKLHDMWTYYTASGIKINPAHTGEHNFMQFHRVKNNVYNIDLVGECGITGYEAAFRNGITAPSIGAGTNLWTRRLVLYSPTDNILAQINQQGVASFVDVNITSDLRYKKNVVRICSPMDKLKKISGYTYEVYPELDSNEGLASAGVVAQEVEEVLPHVVTEDEEGKKTVGYSGVVALLVESVKELSNKIEKLEDKIKEMEMNGV